MVCVCANQLVDVDRHIELARVVVEEIVVHAEIQPATAGSSERPALADEDRRSVTEAGDQTADWRVRKRGPVRPTRLSTGGSHDAAVTSDANTASGIDRYGVASIDEDAGINPLPVASDRNSARASGGSDDASIAVELFTAQEIVAVRIEPVEQIGRAACRERV